MSNAQKITRLTKEIARLAEIDRLAEIERTTKARRDRFNIACDHIVNDQIKNMTMNDIYRSIVREEMIPIINHESTHMQLMMSRLRGRIDKVEDGNTPVQLHVSERIHNVANGLVRLLRILATTHPEAQELLQQMVDEEN